MTGTKLAAALDQALGSEPAPVPTPGPSPGRATVPRQQLLDVRVTDVLPDPDNPREDVGDIIELANSMSAAGLLQPVVCRRRDEDGRLLVVAGHRRLAAAQYLGWATIAVIVRRDMRPDDVLAAMLVENGQRTDLDPVEEARALRRLQLQDGREAPHAELARRIGRTQVHVSGRLALLALPVEEQEAIRAGHMNVGDGIRRGRLAAGRVRPKGSTGSPHLGVGHDLGRKAKARCVRLGHKRSGRNSVGGVACGECWESVIRADEREHLHGVLASQARCPLCQTPTGDQGVA